MSEVLTLPDLVEPKVQVVQSRLELYGKFGLLLLDHEVGEHLLQQGPGEICIRHPVVGLFMAVTGGFLEFVTSSSDNRGDMLNSRKVGIGNGHLHGIAVSTLIDTDIAFAIEEPGYIGRINRGDLSASRTPMMPSFVGTVSGAVDMVGWPTIPATFSWEVYRELFLAD